MDPLHQFVIQPIFKIDCCGFDLSFTNSALAVMTAVALICLIFSCSLRRKSMVPNRWQAIVEIIYNLVASLVNDNIGKKGMAYMSFVLSIFLFILFGNLVGLIPHMFTFTSHIAATFTMAIVSVSFVTILGFIQHGAKFLSIFVPSGAPKIVAPFVALIELMSYLSRPITLGVRLFANMMAGHIVLKVFAGLSVMFIYFAGIPVLVNMLLTGLELVIAGIQAYVFTILTCVYLRDAVYLH